MPPVSPTGVGIHALRLRGLCWEGVMVVADFFDLAIHDFHDLGPDRLHDVPFSWTGAMEERLRHAAPVIAGARPQVAATVREERKAGLVRAPYLCSACKASPLRVHNHRVVVKAGHHALDVVVVERLKV